jgi:hypothetical protein
MDCVPTMTLLPIANSDVQVSIRSASVVVPTATHGVVLPDMACESSHGNARGPAPLLGAHFLCQALSQCPWLPHLRILCHVIPPPRHLPWPMMIRPGSTWLTLTPMRG